MPQLIRLSIKLDSRELNPFRSGAAQRAIFTALRKAGNTAIRRMRAVSKRKIREEKRIKAKYLSDKALPITLPRGAKGIESLVWRMDVSGASVPLGEYPVRQTRRGVSVRVNKNTGPKTILGAFIRLRKDGRTGVFKRPGNERYPMGHKLSSSVDQVFRDKGFIPDVQDQTLEVFQRDFERLVPLELDKTKGK